MGTGKGGFSCSVGGRHWCPGDLYVYTEPIPPMSALSDRIHASWNIGVGLWIERDI